MSRCSRYGTGRRCIPTRRRICRGIRRGCAWRLARAAASRPGDLRASLRGFGPLGLLAIVVILSGNFLFPPLSAVLVLFWARWSGTPWREIGYVRPRSWIGELAAGLILGGLFKLAMKAVESSGSGQPVEDRGRDGHEASTGARRELEVDEVGVARGVHLPQLDLLGRHRAHLGRSAFGVHLGHLLR